MNNDGIVSLGRFKWTEYIIRCSMFTGFFSDQTGCPLAGGRRSYETTIQMLELIPS
ncbi:hypothetical protein D1AOALGA4SA_2341 [Olavius algarvensis Delta 1 endosymbiont]|nr:hypothetical protein D1AOALGA4SA_2341 [Olavius algarvensis Delta 1 endosymbiont]